MSSGDNSFTADFPVPPAVERRRGRLRLPLITGASALIACVAVLFLVNPAESGLYPFCLFHQATGLLCPGCGCLRATHQLLHGNVAAAFHLNQLFVISLPLFAWFAVRLIVRGWQRRPLLTSVRATWVWAGFFILLVFGILRNLPLIQGT